LTDKSEKEKVPLSGTFQISYGKRLSFFLGLEFFLDLFDVNGFLNWLKILKFQRLASNSRFRFVFAVFSLKSGYCHGISVKGTAKIRSKSGIAKGSIKNVATRLPISSRQSSAKQYPKN
jgi:hypothetical protein